MSTEPQALPRIVTREEWLAERKALLAQEKEVTRARDATSARRRRLPMVRVDEPYRFQGPDGPLGIERDGREFSGSAAKRQNGWWNRGPLPVPDIFSSAPVWPL